MKRVLVFGVTENPGGVEVFLLNYYRRLDKNVLQCDFLCNSHKPMAYEDEFLSMGARVFHITPRRENPLAFRRELTRLYKRHADEWDAVWVNVNSLANVDYLKYAKRYGIKRRIIHSHSANMDNWLRALLHHWNRNRIEKYATDFWACSSNAARWFYRSKLLPKAVIIHNAIDVGKMAFDSTVRENMRYELDCEGCMVIGNVGRLRFEKNQLLALQILKAILDKGVKAKLILVGSGEDEQMLREKSVALGIDRDVVFAGFQPDVGAWMNVFDVFLFPSLFEGLGIAAIEAQANGLPVAASEEGVPKEARLNDNFCFVSLKQNPEIWAAKVIDLATKGRVDMPEIKRRFMESGYDITGEVSRLEGLLKQ